MASAAIIMFLLCPMVSIPFIIIGAIKESHNFKTFLILFVGVIGAISYCYSPLATENNDINRYFQIIDLYRAESFDYVEKQSLFSTMPIFFTYMWLIGKTWLNNHFFQFSTTIIGCGCNMALLYRVGKDNDLANPHWQIYTLFVFSAMFNWLCYFSYVRQPVALAVCAYCLYDEFTVKRHSSVVNWGICFATVLWHTSMIILIAIAILSRLKISRKIVGVVLVAWGVFYASIMNLLSHYTSNVIINRLYYMMDTYLGFAVTKAPRWQFVQLVCILSVLIAVIGIAHFNKSVFDKYNGLYWLVLNTGLFTVGSYFQYDLFMRMGWVIFMFGLVVFPVFFSCLKGRYRSLIRAAYTTIALLAGTYQLIAIYIPYSTFVSLPQMLLTNIFTIFLGVA